MAGFVAVTGATGHIGRRALEILAGQKVAVRAIARGADKLAPAPGVEAVAADVTDAAAMERAFSGADAVFVMIPPNVTAADVRADQNRVADSLVEAVRRARVTHVVALSSVGAQNGSGMGPVNGLHDWEAKLRRLAGINVLVLRPSYFMENLLVNAGLIKGQGIMGSPIAPSTRMPMIATRDIGAVVAGALSRREFAGHSVRELLGPRDITMEDARAAIAKAIGKPELRYVQFPYADAEKAMMGMGLSADYARQLVEMASAMNAGTFHPTQQRGPLTNTPTTIEEFASTVFAPALKG